MGSKYIDSQINMALFSKRLKDTIKLSGYTQREFSKKINISANALRNIISGKSLPSLQTYISICHTLDIPFGELLKDSVYEPVLFDSKENAEIFSFISETTDAEKCAIVDFFKILQNLRASN